MEKLAGAGPQVFVGKGSGVGFYGKGKFLLGPFENLMTLLKQNQLLPYLKGVGALRDGVEGYRSSALESMAQPAGQPGQPAGQAAGAASAVGSQASSKAQAQAGAPQSSSSSSPRRGNEQDEGSQKQGSPKKDSLADLADVSDVRDGVKSDLFEDVSDSLFGNSEDQF